MSAIILALLANLPAIISSATAAVQNAQKIVTALRENAAALTPEQRAQLVELEERLIAGLTDVAGVQVLLDGQPIGLIAPIVPVRPAP